MKIFRRSTGLDDFLDAVLPELRAIPTPRAGDALKARILASRVEGVRIILPDVPHHRRRSRRAVVALAIAATLAAALLPFGLWRSTSRAGDFSSPGIFGQAALAQGAPDGQPRLEPVVTSVAGRVRPLSVVYAQVLGDSIGRPLREDTMALTVREAMLEGTRAWSIAWLGRTVADGKPQAHRDTAYVAAADLRLLRRDIHVEPYRRFQRINVHQVFAGDSVSGHMNTEGPSIGEGRSFRRLLSPDLGPHLTETIVPMYLMAVPLGPGWRGSASLLGWAVRDDDVLVPIEFQVEAEESVAVPAGRFDCWRLSWRVSGRQLVYWARKSDGLAVRILDPRHPGTNRMHELLLVREE
jgi:hypothetical protein